MSGISRIQQRQDETSRNRANQSNVNNREIWFKDGDQAFVTPVATGKDDDTLLDEIYLFVYRVGNRWVSVLKDESIDISEVPSDTRPSHKFAFWGYVHEVIHPEKRVDTWEEIEGPGGKKMFKETVNDFRVIPLAFGRSDYIWNQLVDIYSDWGQLDKGVVRVKRTGSGAYDTSYTITATPRDTEVPEDKLSEISELPTIKDYYLDRYSNVPTDPSSSSSNDNDLF